MARPAEGGGRLILPLTADGFPNRDVRHGAVFRIERRGPEFFAHRISGVAIFPCEGGRDETSGQARAAAFDKGGAERVTRRYRRGDLPEEQCSLRAPGWCLATANASDILDSAGPGSGGGRAIGSPFPLEGGMGLRSGVHGADARRPRGPDTGVCWPQMVA